MIYQGQTLTVAELGDGIAELKFDNQTDSVNKFNKATLDELAAAAEALATNGNVKGLLVSSGKDVFIVGADITEFGAIFASGPDQVKVWLAEANKIFNAIEDLPFPTVTAINGIALGGGFEMALSTDYRVASNNAQVGLPEVKLGIIPGFGGTVRLPRLVGADNAIEWAAAGKQAKMPEALKNGAVDAVVAPEKLQEAALKLLNDAIAGKFDWKERRAQKTGPLKLGPVEKMMVFTTAKGFIAGQAGKHYPAPLALVKGIEKAAGKDRDGALPIEHDTFVEVALTPVAESLISLFMNDQLIKKKSKGMTKADAHKVEQAAVLGAGIMGGGIAYQSASKGTPIIMKDINNKALQLGLDEASGLLGKQVARKKMTPEKMAGVLNNIRDTLNYGDFKEVDIVVEAVIENPKIKQSVLAEVEGEVGTDCILASNTSTISITHLAEALKRPENFCGMHFFNPVHRMPLVEVIRGEKTSDAAIATTVAYATAMGKTPIVVNDCPGFLVNRVLFPYFAGFQMLVAEGADFMKVDKVMEGFGWPMGPAYLLDVVGIDTAHHAQAVMADGFPDRMATDGNTSMDVMFNAERYGQKNDKGYYQYVLDRKGKSKKTVDPEAVEMVKSSQTGQTEFDEPTIIERHMIPMVIETARCLEEGIVETPNEADMGLILGIGFPPFRGGALKYADTMGLQAFCDMADKYKDLGKLYEPTAKMREMAASGATYYPKTA